MTELERIEFNTESGTIITCAAPPIPVPVFGNPAEHELQVQSETVCGYPVDRLVCSCGWAGEWHHRRFQLRTEGQKCPNNNLERTQYGS